ncbi:MAG: adenylate/guanylate cyclase domain-containing protein [Myxococcota bacterium]|nr:adenylate/guanylate cyclase domain-containing protein [Myxococcota bacterium]
MHRWLLYAALLLSAACASDGAAKKLPSIQDGRLDLSDWDFESDGALDLDGRWLFAWKSFVAIPSDITDVESAFPARFEVPGYWGDSVLSSTGEELSSEGFATYALRIDGLKGRALAVPLPDVLSAVCLYTLSEGGERSKRYCRGQPGTRAEDEIGHYYSYELMPIGHSGDGEGKMSSTLLVMEMSNFVHSRGGVSRSIQLQNFDRLTESTLSKRLRKAFALGILFCFGFYHLLLSRFRRDDNAMVLFGLFVLSTLLRDISTGSIRLFDNQVSELSFDLLIRFEYVTIPLCIMSGTGFLLALIPSEGFRRIVRALVGIGTLFTLIPLLTPLAWFSQLVEVYQMFAALGGLIVVGHLLLTARQGNRIALYMLGAFAIILVAIVNDILHTRGLIQTNLFLAEALILVVVAQALILAGRNRLMHERLVRLTENLQEEVATQTLELEQKKQAAEDAQAEVQQLNDYITESVLKRYLPPALIGDILSGELSMDKPAELRDITVLFSDLKGFTAASEALGPEGISAFLNEYLTVMNEVIFEHGGTIDKFIGDAIMVLFGAPKEMSKEDQVRRAVFCAKAMQIRLKALTHAWQREGAGRLDMRIGIHHGPAVVGNFGSAQRSDYTAIGPSVNMTARIEAACDPGHVFVSETAAKLMDEGDTEEAGVFELKGIEGRATLYRVL